MSGCFDEVIFREPRSGLHVLFERQAEKCDIDIELRQKAKCEDGRKQIEVEILVMTARISCRRTFAQKRCTRIVVDSNKCFQSK